MGLSTSSEVSSPGSPVPGEPEVGGKGCPRAAPSLPPQARLWPGQAKTRGLVTGCEGCMVLNRLEPPAQAWLVPHALTGAHGPTKVRSSLPGAQWGSGQLPPNPP